MIRIGICDDNEKDRKNVYSICKNFFEKNPMEHEYILFSSGEEVLEYCEGETNDRIELLFLDIELNGINGIETKDRIVKEDKVWRIVFVSSYKDKVWATFGLKTIGFVIKPATQEEIHKWINVVLEELEEDALVELKGMDGQYIRLEKIAYFKAAGNYTELYLHTGSSGAQRPVLVLQKLGELEKDLQQFPIIRVHKSYMVNLVNVVDMDADISMRDMREKIPIGRVYKETVRKRYLEYGKEKIRRRM